ncbi:MAG: elongation factor 1-beta [Methanomassiliicoccaceae archaeon]|nr:elongation factor 1-beta [Methanomassiliicoccaceae archaeon]
MGKIATTYDLMPESTDVPLDDVVKALKGVIPEGVQMIEAKIEPVAFGLKKVVVFFVVDDTIDGVGGALEDALHSIPGVENAECTSSALL